MKTPALKPSQRVFLPGLLIVMVIGGWIVFRKPGGWWKGGACTFTLVEHGGFDPQSQGVYVSNAPHATNQTFPPTINYVARGKAADEIIHVLNHYDVWRWDNETKLPKQDAVACTAVLEYRGKTNHWAWYPSSNQLRPDENPFAKTMRNLGKYGTPNTPDMQKQFSKIWQVILTHTNDLTRIR